MTIYTVHAPPAAEGAAPDPAAFVFVKDGFSWPALFIPPVWLIWHRLWLALLIWVAAVVALSVLSGLAGADASSVVMLLFAVWFALEANGFRRWTLERRSYALVGVVEGRRVEAAERRFFAGTASADVSPGPVSSAPASAPSAPSVAASSPSSALSGSPRQGGIVGLFPAPGYRR